TGQQRLLEQLFCFKPPEPTGEANCNCGTGDCPEQQSYSGLPASKDYLSKFFVLSRLSRQAKRIAIAVLVIDRSSQATPAFADWAVRSGLWQINSSQTGCSK
ncbi:MAG TPA: hypothetical protein VLL47_10695, partial [Robiginitalea sp.]|nr:hypothetical protein [Robiginitalea sp.]